MQVWDEATRPTGPAPDPDRRYTAGEEATGQHLVDIHDHLRAELDQVYDLIEQVEAGTATTGAARSHTNTMTMRQNKWVLGGYCESYCRVVTTHHTIEDQAVLSDSLLSHLSYEERELVEPLARLGVG